MQGPNVAWYLVVAALLFATGSIGVLLRRSPLIGLIVCVNFRSRFGPFRFRIIRSITPGADQLCLGDPGRSAPHH